MPNPADDHVIVTGHGIEGIEVLDAMGRMMMHRSFQNEEVVELDVRGLSKGVYCVRVAAGTGWSSSRLIKD
jgi:hypothetical protein